MGDLIQEAFSERVKIDLAYLQKSNWEKLGVNGTEFKHSIEEVLGPGSGVINGGSARLEHLRIISNLHFIAQKEPLHWRRWLAWLAYGYCEKGNLFAARQWGLIAGEKTFVQKIADQGISDQFINPDTILLEYLCGADWDPELLSLPSERLIGRWGTAKFSAFFTPEHRAALFIKSMAEPKDPEMIAKLVKHFIDENELAKGRFVALPDHPGYAPLPTALAIRSELSPDTWRKLLPPKYHRVIGPALQTETTSKEVLPPYFSRMELPLL